MNAPFKPKLLVVEDDEGLQRQLRWAYDDYEVLVATDRAAAIDLVRSQEPAVVTLDLGLPPDPDGVTEGFATLETILSLKPDTKVIVASGHGARESALRAIGSGAYDFYQKPVDVDQLGLIVRRAFQLHEIENENRRLEEKVGDSRTVLGTMVTAAPEMMKVARTIERVATTDVSVMLLGASGTGKELLARGVHEASRRRDGAFVAINCAAIPENLLEAELFGYEKGAFTGAIKTTEGKIELAEGGTLFLDEVGDIPLPLQVKLLRFLQEREFERLGSTHTKKVDLRLVAATNRDLEKMVEERQFRNDLYYRLNVFPIRIPPLRERPEDIPLLVHYFTQKYARRMEKQIDTVPAAAIKKLTQWHWPGNIRELENFVERAVILTRGTALQFPTDELKSGSVAPKIPNGNSAERDEIVRVLRDANGRVGGPKGAAARLGLKRTTLISRMKKLGISITSRQVS